MSPERWSSLLAYCRLEPEELTAEDTVLLETLYSSATGYMEQAGVAEPEDSTPRRAQYDLCVNFLTLDAWDRRGMSITGSALTENPGFRRLLNQLKLTEPELIDGG